MKVVLLAHAFGRRSIADEEVANIILPIVNKTKDFLAAISEIITTCNINPGISNQIIANLLVEIHKKGNIDQIVVQWEIVCALWKNQHDWLLQNKEKIFCVWPLVRGYINTKEMIDMALEKFPQHQFNVLAHPAMKTRISLLFKKMAAEFPFFYNVYVPFDPKSIQIWTKNELFWIIYDFAVLIHHKLNKWI